MESIPISDYEVEAAKLEDPATGVQTVGLVLRSRATGKAMALRFDSDPQLCGVLTLLMAAAKQVWPRGWESVAEKRRVKTEADPAALRGLNTEATVPGDTFVEVNGNGDAWRVALVSNPHDAPSRGMAVTINMPRADLKPVALTFTQPSAGLSFLAGVADAVERLWPGTGPLVRGVVPRAPQPPPGPIPGRPRGWTGRRRRDR